MADINFQFPDMNGYFISLGTSLEKLNPLLSAFSLTLANLKIPSGLGRGRGSGSSSSGGPVSDFFEDLGMADGGFVPARRGGSLRLLGEGGQGEHVIPDNDLKDMFYEQQRTNDLLGALVKQNNTAQRRARLRA